MSLEIVNYFDLEIENQLKIAQTIEDYTHGKSDTQPQMIPVTTADINNKYLGLVAIKNDEFAGYISSEKPKHWKDESMAEVGTLWVPKSHQKQGIAHNLIDSAKEQFSDADILPFAFCNSLSLKIFKECGFVPTATDNIPKECFNLCQKCPAKPDTGCCDTVVIWSKK